MAGSSTPTAAVIDAQSNRASPQGGDSGFDAAKKVKGRKRNLVVDTMGLLVALTVTAASVRHRDAAAAVVAQACTKVLDLKNVIPAEHETAWSQSSIFTSYRRECAVLFDGHFYLLLYRMTDE